MASGSSRIGHPAAAYTGDVTALCLLQLPRHAPDAPATGSDTAAAATAATASLLLAGVGSQLHVYELRSGRLAACATVLPDATRVHGIACLPARHQALVAVHGGRHAALLRLLGPASGSSAGAWQVQALARLPRLGHWSLDVQLADASGSSSSSSSSTTTTTTSGGGSTLLLAVGLSNNSVEAFSVQLAPGALFGASSSSEGSTPPPQASVRRLLHAQCARHCLLYSMALAERPQQGQQGQQQESGAVGGMRWLVAAGTILREVLVWATPGVPVRWSPCAGLLASASDDRSLRLWAIPAAAAAAADAPTAADAAAADTATTLEPLRALWGHTARLWDCRFGGAAPGGSASTWLVTASEDCSCRVWCLATGSLLAVLQGHRGRGIWNCAVLEQPPPPAAAAAGAAEAEAAAAAAAARCCLVTGGADGSIKWWRLADCLPLQAAAAGGAQELAVAGAQAECIMLRGTLPEPDAAEVGLVATCGAEQQQPPPPPQQQQQQEDDSSAVATDSRAEWVRCLALARSGRLPSSGGWRARWLYVATNRGLLHRVHLPGDGQPERWECLLKSCPSRPLVGMRLLQAHPSAAPSASCTSGTASADSGCGCSEAVWVALVDLAGTATVLLDRPDCSSGAGGPSHCCSWQPHGAGAGGTTAVWWGGAARSGLGPRFCFTSTGAQGAPLTAWLLPPPPAAGQAQAQEPVRLAEARLPFWGRVSALAAALLPQPVGPQQHQATLVAVSDTGGAVAVLLLTLPSGLAEHAPPAGADGCARSGAELLVLAASRGVHANTPVRTVSLRLPHSAQPSSLCAQLAGAEVVTAAADGLVRTTKLPPAAVDAAQAAIAAQPQAPQGSGAGAAATAVPPPRLLGAGWRRIEGVSHIDGMLQEGGCDAAAAGRSPGGSSSPGVVWGFHTASFTVWDEAAEAEVARVPCGGWRRPTAADVAGADDLALCFLRGGRLSLYRRRPNPRLPPRCLHTPHHGTEQSGIRLLAVPCASAGEEAAVYCITGGEDAQLRQRLLPCGSPSGGAFAAAALLAEQAGGGAVKSLVLLPLPAGSLCGDDSADSQQWLLLSGGARRTLLACCLRLPRNGPAGRLPLLRCNELAATGPARDAPQQQRKAAAGSRKAESEQRYLSVSAFLWPHQQQPPPLEDAATGAAAAAQPPLLFVVAAASDASLELLHADLAALPCPIGGRRGPPPWQPAARLQHHSCPVLCTAHIALQLATAPAGAAGTAAALANSSACAWQRHIVCSGATDGAVAVWDVTRASAAAACAPGEPGAPAPCTLAPMLVLAGLHQSGVNCMAVQPAGPGQLLLLTGGDDQALCLALLRLRATPAGCACTEVVRLCAPNAHASALRSVWLAPPAQEQGPAGGVPAPAACATVAFSVGLDQQLRWWRLRLERQPAAEPAPHGAAPSLPPPEQGSSAACSSDGVWRLQAAEAGCRFTQVVEPAALDVVPQPGTSACGGCQYLVGVAGRGTEVLAWGCPL